MGPNGVPYVTRLELPQYITATVLNLFDSATLDQACIDASVEADGYMAGRYAMPLLQWDSTLKAHVAHIAYYYLAKRLGFAPQAGSDRLIVEDYYRAVGWPDRPGTGWFPGVQRQAIHPNVTPSIPQPGDNVRDLPQISTSPQRGWQAFTTGGKPTVG